MNFLVSCASLGPIISLIKAIIKLIQFGIPIILILLIIIDLGKAVLASKEDEMKKAQDIAIKRAIYALIIFFVPFIVGVVFDLVDGNSGANGQTGDTIMSCWNSN